MKIFLPYHLGCGNRGCEGICRGISKIFNANPSDLVLYNMTQSEFYDDKKLGIDEIGELKYRGSFIFESGRVIVKALRKIGFTWPYLEYMSEHYLAGAKAGDYFLMTGGDIYCYENGYVLPNLLAKKAKKKGLKSIIYCASFEEKYLSPSVIKGLSNYDVILTRESISAAALQKLGIQNTIIPDPAFTLEPTPVELPEFFNKRPIVGLNFSPYTNSSDLFEENIVKLCEYCDEIDMDVCLIPHVFWKGQDDRDAMNVILSKLGKNVHFLDSTKYSYLQIRYIISKCKYFIGGRTHSVISAYSTKVPCLALGYSVKAKGIAKDIGMPDYTVLDSKNFKSKNDLIDAFRKLIENEQEIKKAYENLNTYVKRCYEAKRIVE
ncbi:MAG: polysaccharide pyruvyl transferase family protein [Butyrivibrio sp.]|nr:polysaccharide pyruvyl transferase family protein [Butyrivibrio sp.]